MENLTDEQRAQIARNREIALQRLAERKKRLELEAQQAQASNSNNAPQTSNVVISSVQDSAKVEINFAYQESFPLVNVKVFVENLHRIKPFNSIVINVIKNLKTKSYNANDQFWTLNFCDYFPLMNKLKEVRGVKLDIEGLPIGVTRVFHNELDGKPALNHEVCLKKIDPRIVDILFPYQKVGVQFGISRGGRILIADEMGLGKTIQALAIASYYNKEWPLLIICPSSVKFTWKQQIEKFLPDVTDVFVIDKASDPFPKNRSTTIVVIMSYDQMKIRSKELRENSLYVIIFDESHFIKDQKAKRTQVATELGKKATRVILLSGTPALSRPIELLTQIQIVNPVIFPRFMEFAMRYCDGRQGRWNFEAKGATNTNELSAILEKTIMIRRLKKDVLNDLPDKRREIIYLTGSILEDKLKSLTNARMGFLKASSSSDVNDKKTSLMEYFVATGNAKAQSVTNYVLENFFYEGAQPRKLLIFAHHQIVLDTLEANMRKMAIKYIRIDGKTNADQRFKNCEAFQNKEDVKVAILSITAAGVGITLTAASVVIFGELHWNPGFLAQAEDRAHRVGQKDSVLVQYILAKNTADDDIFPLIQKKLKILSSVKLSSDSYKDAENIHRDLSDQSITNFIAKITEDEDLSRQITKKNSKNCDNESDLEEVEWMEPEPKRPKSIELT